MAVLFKDVIPIPLLLLIVALQTAAAATFTVSNTNYAGVGSLDSAVTQANTNFGPDSIDFTVTGMIDINTTLFVSDDLIIAGPGVDTLVLNSKVTAGFDALRFGSNSPGDLTLEISDLTFQQDVVSTKRLIRAVDQSSLTVRNAKLTGNGNEIVGSSGGAIASQNTDVILQNVEIKNFNTTYRGGAVFLSATADSDSANLTAENCLFEDNVTSGDFSDVTATKHGGAIAAEITSVAATADIDIRDSSFINNTSSPGSGTVANGGAIHSAGNITINSSYFFQNTAPVGNGGAIYSEPSPNSAILISNSLFLDNSAIFGAAGAVGVRGKDVTIENSTFAENKAGTAGGALHHDIAGTIDIVNSTFSGNEASGSIFQQGGAVYINSTGPGAIALNLLHVTMTGNTAVDGGAIYNDASDAFVTAVNSVIASNSEPEIFGEITIDFSHIGDNAGDAGMASITELTPGNSIFDTDPMLAALADNGGQHVGKDAAYAMTTHALLMNSVLIGAGDSSATNSAITLPANDQRGDGFTRIKDGGVEIGALEYDMPVSSSSSSSSSSSGSSDSGGSGSGGGALVWLLTGLIGLMGIRKTVLACLNR
jgi:hypothetical protein